MTNLEAVERFDQAHGAKIERLYWIAGSMDNSDFKDLVSDDFTDEDWKSIFPEIVKGGHLKEYRKDKEEMQAFCDYRKFGFLAEIHVPEASGFKFKNDSKKPWAWSVNGGICKIRYAYAETTDELMSKIEIEAKSCLDYDIKKELKKLAKSTV